MKKISIIILFAIFFIGCSSNDYKQNSIPMSELNKRWNAWLYRPRFHSEQSGFILIKE